MVFLEFLFEGGVVVLQGLEVCFDFFVRGFMFCGEGLELVFFDFEFVGCVC